MVWDEPNTDWTQFDAVVIRSPWGYQRNPQKFLQTLGEIEAAGTPLLNPLRICQWNIDKNYLRKLGEQGHPIVPTLWFNRLAADELPHIFEQLGTAQIVVKPTVGAGAEDTYSLNRDDPLGWQAALDAFALSPLMVQPFVQSVVTHGEFSLIYFGGRFSHAIVKKPKPKDFRVQEEHGGALSAIEADTELLRAAEGILSTVGQKLLYARVDLVLLEDGAPALMELELIEPSLYFSYAPRAATRFAETLVEMLADF